MKLYVHAAAYTAGFISNELGLPMAITLALSMGSGIAVSKLGSKYVFKTAVGLSVEWEPPKGTKPEAIQALDDAAKGSKKLPDVISSFADMMPPEEAARYKLWMDLREAGYDIPVDEYIKIREMSIKNASSDTMTLGKYFEDANGNPTPDAYVTKAHSTGNTYFDLGKEWDNIKREYNLSKEDMFNLFNKPALDDAVASGKEIRFSQDPRLYENDTLGEEWEYLKKKGYKKLIQKGDYWYAK